MCHLAVDWPEERCDGLYGRHVCEDCGKMYKHTQSLWKHRRFECGKEPSFFCPYCPHRCKRAAHLRRHVSNVHPGYPAP